MVPEAGIDQTWLVCFITMLLVLTAASNYVIKTATMKGVKGAIGKIAFIFLFFFCILLFFSLIFSTANQIFILLAGTVLGLTIISLLCDEKTRPTIVIMTFMAFIIMVLYSPKFERYLASQEKAKLERQEFVQQQAEVFSDYLCGAEIDAADAWWLAYPDYGIGYMVCHKDTFLPIVNAAEDCQYTELLIWWKERGMSKMRINFHLQLNPDDLPLTAQEIRDAAFVK